MRIVFMGTPYYVVPVLELLQQSPGLEIVAVYTPPDRARGRGRVVEATPVKLAALEAGLPVMQPASLRSDEVRREMAGMEPDVAIVAAYGKLLPPAALEAPKHGCLNIHPSLLPRYRGPSPVVTALLDGVETTGVTLMLLDEGMDTGPILVQENHTLRGDETAGQLTEELFVAGGRLLVENLADWTAGRLSAVAQDDRLATVTRKVERADGLIDWSSPAVALERRHRAFSPWPGLFTQWEDKTLRLMEATTMAEGCHETDGAVATPGRVLALDSSDAPVGVVTGCGILALKRVQLEGRRPVTAGEFLRGYPSFPGSQL